MDLNVTFEVFQRVGTTGFDFVSVANVDNIISLTVTRRYTSYDTFTATLPVGDVDVSFFRQDNLVLIDDEYFYIDQVQGSVGDNGELVVSGKSLSAKAIKRIVARIYTATKRPEQIAYDHFHNEVVSPSQIARKIDYVSLLPIGTLTNASISYQNSYGVVMDEVESLMQTYDFGMREIATDYESPHQTIEFYKGEDKSNLVEFTVCFENLLDESFEQSNFDERTMAYVYGDGEGAKRTQVKIGDNLSGLERSEIYVDARDKQRTIQNDDGTETSLTDAQYNAMLLAEGNDKLSDQSATLTINGDIDLQSQLFVYKRDYNVGDRVKLTSEMFGLSKTALLSSVEETWDGDGHHLTPTWDKESPTVIDVLKRIAKGR